MKSKKSDNRRNKRLECRVPVDGKEGKPFAIAQTLDISKGGLGFLSRKSILPNEKIAVQLELGPDEEPILIAGSVRWVQKLLHSNFFRFGIKFDGILYGSKNRLDKFLKV